MALALREASSFIFSFSVKKPPSYFYWSEGKICGQVKKLKFHLISVILIFCLSYLMNQKLSVY